MFLIKKYFVALSWKIVGKKIKSHSNVLLHTCFIPIETTYLKDFQQFTQIVFWNLRFPEEIRKKNFWTMRINRREKIAGYL